MPSSIDTSVKDLRVLLVDDEIFIREMGVDVLMMLGCKATTAEDGKKAWEIFQKSPADFDIIISDYNMPEMTGIDLAERVLSLRPGMPFIISTGFSSGFTEKAAEDLGIASILQKPYLVNQLKEAIQHAVSRSPVAG